MNQFISGESYKLVGSVDEINRLLIEKLRDRLKFRFNLGSGCILLVQYAYRAGVDFLRRLHPFDYCEQFNEQETSSLSKFNNADLSVGVQLFGQPAEVTFMLGTTTLE